MGAEVDAAAMSIHTERKRAHQPPKISKLYGLDCGLCGHQAESMTVYALRLVILHVYATKYDEAFCERRF